MVSDGCEIVGQRHCDIVIEAKANIQMIQESLKTGSDRMVSLGVRIDNLKDKINVDFTSLHNDIFGIDRKVSNIYAYAAGLGTVAGIVSAVIVNIVMR